MRNFYERVLTDARQGRLLQTESVSGGCIHQTLLLRATKGDCFLKWSEEVSAYEMFYSEADGLRRLERAGLLTPEVLALGRYEEKAYLLLRYIDAQPAAAHYWEVLAKQLAQLHNQTAAHFGLETDNFIGALPQKNVQKNCWRTFFLEQRLRPLVSSPPLSVSLLKAFDHLYLRLPQLLPKEKPALLHGDLWSGNLHRDSAGLPCWIDPAVYYGAKEMELALPVLFGGFSERFYIAYEEAAPLQPGWQERVEIYTLYPLLVHVHLFGPQYLRSIEQRLAHFL